MTIFEIAQRILHSSLAASGAFFISVFVLSFFAKKYLDSVIHSCGKAKGQCYPETRHYNDDEDYLCDKHEHQRVLLTALILLITVFLTIVEFIANF